MEEGTEEVVEQQESVETPEAETTEETPTPTQSDVRADIEAELAKVREELTKSQESYKGLQRTLNKANEEKRNLAGLKAEIDDQRETMKILAAMIADGRDSENITPEQKTDYLKKFDDLQNQQKAKRQQEEAKVRLSDLQQRTIDLGLTQSDPEYWDIHDAATNLQFSKAEALISKLEATKKTEPKKEEPVVDDIEKKVQAEVDKRLAEMAKTNPLLKTDTTVPAGKASTYEEALEKWTNGEITHDEYAEARRKAGLYL